jgi:gamma-glutamylcyclotransferase (GGCT)/AIG2-like uncharacterized protein YtfP
MTGLLFVYGTLLEPDNSFANYLHQNSTYVSAGKIKGALYDIGEYPGAVITGNHDGYVYGHLLQLHQPEQNLKTIDDYEGFGPEQEQPNLYLREILSVEVETGIVNAWVYLYNLPINGLPQITDGNYTAYKPQKKSPVS